MDLNFIWKAIVIVIGGILILRLAGRKSISQLTVAQTVMMVAVGSLIIQPVGDRNIWITMVITLLLVLTLIFVEYLVMKFDKLESFFYSKSVMVVENGQLNVRNLRRLRLTVDMLEVRLRQQSIPRITDLQWATIESNGQLGYQLKPEKEYATKEDIQQILAAIKDSKLSDSSLVPKTPSVQSNDLFSEVANNKHVQDPPEHLK
ncbi:uncharacterized membrane protein YcaP (DUF421 family) [Bacillus mesophilus]|uniref:DUF421 domain-containing protein n=1 Tax=Bacillus mesophilus TaxID=1808955 RepID=A0A6M0Q321_9BACI|nr:YetF domain-containing protein [Bacillus mesophilus]MBM7659878.1 uncharacterized membrane protein YcaP (DUF421 family) [Bacillus mesophilus]NEY70737.1 DUF421 domain-containing protein [Bacillus mesophilus]